ncbi:CDP-diacylglycerol diphosphatase [Mycobacterium sp. EPa45]|uniref:CDP-diacylglycerol diphosphatase n=1 Tax=Mycobacterium sp. EPa45 TaxID=1545728 RepID=UPI0006418C4C|nr:CDP-diacylglycerol diphosphatase [Mycobacterium sp. EPa45]AKK30592.1 CDP-diacylglycerol pyrophosphatase [Mycobacterium sp. EPa45]
MRHTRGSGPLAAALALLLLAPGAAHADPDALWNIVHDQCVVDVQQHRDPAPCARVDLSGGEGAGYAVFKDMVGDRQYLLIPTARIAGIESPELLNPHTVNYFGAAWQARSFVEQRAGGTIPRDWMSLAVNSAVARTQNQLHIHVDCLRADVHDALRSAAGAIGAAWAPLPVPLTGHTYWAMGVDGTDLDANPFRLLADGLDGARDDMGQFTLVVVGAANPVGRAGFVVLADRADATGSAGGEELQDHDACPALQPASSATAK